MKDEITWEILQKESGCPYPVQEMTTVSKKLRRVARFDWELAANTADVNRPTRIAVNGLDYISFENERVESYSRLTSNAREFIGDLEAQNPQYRFRSAGQVRR